MTVPFEAFIPMGLVVVMFGITGTGFSLAKRLTNEGKVCAKFEMRILSLDHTFFAKIIKY